MIKAYKGGRIDSLLDLGTADALMLDMLDQNLNIKTAVGLDFSIELLSTNTKLNLVEGNAIELPFKDNLFDVVVATAVIEHVPEPEKMIIECYRVLRQDGINIFTTPDPFFEHIATKIGNLKAKQHQKTFKLSELVFLLKSKGFRILKAEKFMVSPLGFPYEVEIEKIIKMIGFGFLLLNQLVVGQKIG